MNLWRESYCFENNEDRKLQISRNLYGYKNPQIVLPALDQTVAVFPTYPMVIYQSFQGLFTNQYCHHPNDLAFIHLDAFEASRQLFLRFFFKVLKWFPISYKTTSHPYPLWNSEACFIDKLLFLLNILLFIQRLFVSTRIHFRLQQNKIQINFHILSYLVYLHIFYLKWFLIYFQTILSVTLLNFT